MAFQPDLDFGSADGLGVWCIIIHTTPVWCAIGLSKLRKKCEQTSCLEMSSPMNESSGSSHTKSGLCFATKCRTALANSSPVWTASATTARRPCRAEVASYAVFIPNPPKLIVPEAFQKRLQGRFLPESKVTSEAC